MAFKRLRNGVLLFKIETTENVDAAPVGTDAIKVEAPKVAYNTQMIDTNEVSGSLDKSVPIPGGTQMTLTWDYYLKGAGTAGAAPEWGKTLKCCGWTETLTAAAIGAPTALTAGTTTTGTLGAPFSGADQAYRGMLIELSGTLPAGFTSPGLSCILNWVNSTKVATFADTAGAVFTTGALALIPANALYTPGSTAIPSATIYYYEDGILKKCIGARGTFKTTITAGGAAKASFTFQGTYGGETDAANASPTYDTTLKPIWKNPGGAVGGLSAFTIDKLSAALKTFTFDNGMTMVMPDDPNANEGFDAAQHTMRNMALTIDPYQTSIATRDIMSDLRAGTARVFHARLGTAAGNRVSFLFPTGTYTKADPGDNNGLSNRAVTIDCGGNDAAGGAICAA